MKENCTGERTQVMQGESLKIQSAFMGLTLNVLLMLVVICLGVGGFAVLALQWMWEHLRVGLVSVVLLCGVSQAQITRVEVTSVEYKQACDGGYCRLVPKETTAISAGVVIGHTEDSQSVIATAGHMFRGRISSITVCGHPATLKGFKYDEHDDIGVLTVNQDWEAASVGDDAANGEGLTLCGYPTDAYTERQGIAITSAVASMPADQGFSGGPLIDNRRRVRGICFGYAIGDVKRRTMFTPAGRMSEFVRSKVRMRTVTHVDKYAVAPPPPSERPVKDLTSPVQAVPAETVPGNLDARLTAIEKAIGSLKQIAGPQGPAGKDGLPGVVTVILKDSSGKELNRAVNVASGAIVELNVSKVLKGK